LERKTNTAQHDNNEHIPSIVVQVDTVYNFCISHLPKVCVTETVGEHFKVQDRRLLWEATIRSAAGTDACEKPWLGTWHWQNEFSKEEIQ